MKPGTPPLKSTRLLDQMRERIRYMHYSLSTEKIYLYRVRFFIRWHGRDGQMQHPRNIGAPGLEAFLTMLATERKVSASTHNQALSAVFFLYREVLEINLPWLNDIRTVQELLGDLDVSATKIYTHVLNVAAGRIPRPLDALPSSVAPVLIANH